MNVRLHVYHIFQSQLLLLFDWAWTSFRCRKLSLFAISVDIEFLRTASRSNLARLDVVQSVLIRTVIHLKSFLSVIVVQGRLCLLIFVSYASAQDVTVARGVLLEGFFDTDVMLIIDVELLATSHQLATVGIEGSLSVRHGRGWDESLSASRVAVLFHMHGPVFILTLGST